MDHSHRASALCAPVFVVLIVAQGCSQESLEGTDCGVNESVGTEREAFSPAAVERVIPLKFVQTMPLTAEQQRAEYAQNQKMVQLSNSVYHPAGVQFYLRSFVACDSPSALLRNPDALPVSWLTVRPYIACAIPRAASAPEPSGIGPRSPGWWEDWATVEYGDPTEVVVWLQDLGLDGNHAQMPWLGNSIHLWKSQLAGHLAHELGHTLGSGHTFDVGGYVASAVDPETGSAFQLGDFWDLVYVPGTSPSSPHRYFDSRADALSVNQSTLTSIDQDGNCLLDASHRLTCNVCLPSYPPGPPCDPSDPGAPYVETLHWPATDPAMGLKGIGFTYSTPDNPPYSYHWGTNMMSYVSTNWHTSISDSFARLIRKFLRFDVVMGPGSTHPNRVNRTSLRGQYLNRQPAYALDFDRDGKRDTAWWEPPITADADGWFRVILSNGGRMDVEFGRLGDVPILADYNGDGVTDLAVFQPGGGVNRDAPTQTQAWWRICPTDKYSAPLTTCTPSSVLAYQFGEREDVPFPGQEYDGYASTGHLTIYRPSSRTWVWGPVDDWDASTDTVRTLGESSTTVPLPGLYDGDGLTDIVAYDTTTGKFYILPSTLSWNSQIIRNFPASSDAGTMPIPHAVPVPGMASHIYYQGSYRPRLGLSLWWPDTGVWNTMWNPVSNATQSACQWGQRGDIPIGGIGTSSNDLATSSYSRMTVYRPGTEYDGPGYFHFRQISNLTCGSYNSVYTYLARPRTLAYAVGDMTGDSLPELWIVSQDNLNTAYYLTSESGYTNAISVTLGSHLAVLL